MKDLCEIINGQQFNRLTQSLDRNMHQLNPSILDDDYFNQIETISMGIDFDKITLNDELTEYLDSLETFDSDELEEAMKLVILSDEGEILNAI